MKFKLRTIKYLIENKKLYKSYNNSSDYQRLRRYVFGGSKHYDKGFVHILNGIKNGLVFTEEQIFSMIHPVTRSGRKTKEDYYRLGENLIASGGVGFV